MRKPPQFSEEASKAALENLLLPLASEARPFELVGAENDLGPDDWAWIFLSMSKDYQDAYQDRTRSSDANDDKARDEDERISLHLLDEADSVNVRADHDGSCRKRFGLAAWLNPTAITLPQLKNKLDSWFFPLNCPISEDYRREEVGDKVHVRSGPLYASQLDKHPHLVVNETPFGYQTTSAAPYSTQHMTKDWGITWVAVDCSVPPDGQVSALKTLASMNRRYLQDFGYKTYDDFHEDAVVEITNSDAFEHMHFSKAGGATEKAEDVATLWRAVYVDALGPIGIQTDKILKKLKVVHQILHDKGLIKPPKLRRFKNTITSEKDRDGEVRHGGSYLKALCVIAELSEWGWSTNKIAQITGICDGNGRYTNRWREQFHNDIDAYVVDAKDMIGGGYRWLVQAQKPDKVPSD